MAGGNETAVSSLSAGGVDEENPYLASKAPLSVTERVPQSRVLPVLPSTRTAGTMEMDLEDDDDDNSDDETAEVKTRNEKESVILADENLTSASGDELKVFDDAEEEEEEVSNSTVSSENKHRETE